MKITIKEKNKEYTTYDQLKDGDSFFLIYAQKFGIKISAVSFYCYNDNNIQHFFGDFKAVKVIKYNAELTLTEE